MFEKEKKQMIEAALKMKEYHLISLTGGNVSMRVAEDKYLVTPSGMYYETMKPEDIVLINGRCEVLEGKRKPSSDASALVYIFEHKKEVGAIVHTHQPYATAIGLNNDKLPACLVTIIDANHADVPVAPWTPSQDVGMGKLCVEYATDANAVIMKNHGVIACGADLEDALFGVVYLEEAAKTYVLARIMGEVEELPPEEIAKERSGWVNYGQ